jgi:Ca2+-binding EF-hand superfamily protein
MGNKQSNEDLSKPLTEEKILEISRKTNLTRDEVLKWHSEFLRDCPNGKLEKKLFINIYKQSFPMGDATKFCKICFMAFDKDKSGYIDFYEFISTIGIFAKGNIQDKLKLAFDIYDYNDDGYIERKEAEQIVSVNS